MDRPKRAQNRLVLLFPGQVSWFMAVCEVVCALIFSVVQQITWSEMFYDACPAESRNPGAIRQGALNIGMAHKRKIKSPRWYKTPKTVY